MSTIDLRCPREYSRDAPTETPDFHARENQSVAVHDYATTAFQRLAGLDRLMQKRTPRDSLIGLFGGGRLPRQFDEQKLREHTNAVWTVDFDPEARSPRIFCDFNHLPTDLDPARGPIRDLLATYRQQAAAPQPGLDALIALVENRDLGLGITSHTLRWVRRGKRIQLLRICASLLHAEGNFVIADKTEPQYIGHAGTSSGFQEAQEVFRHYPDVRCERFHIAPVVPRKVYNRSAKEGTEHAKLTRRAEEMNDVTFQIRPARQYPGSPLGVEVEKDRFFLVALAEEIHWHFRGGTPPSTLIGSK